MESRSLGTEAAGGNAEASTPSDELVFRALVDSIADYAIFLLDPQGTVRSWNAGAQRIKGWSASEIIGRHFSVFYPIDDIDGRKPWRELELALANGRHEDEGWRLRRDGSLFWANVVITPIYAIDGQHLGFSKITRDLTERKQAELVSRRLALLDQQEAIGAEILARTVSSLFRIGMGLQAMMFQTDDQAFRRRLEASIDDLDSVISEVRTAVYRPQKESGGGHQS